jgi:hypothetical protein
MFTTEHHEDSWVHTDTNKSTPNNGQLPIGVRYACWFFCVAAVAGILFFLYTELPSTRHLKPTEAVLPMAVLFGASLLLFEPLAVLVIKKFKKKGDGPVDANQDNSVGEDEEDLVSRRSIAEPDEGLAY